MIGDIVYFQDVDGAFGPPPDDLMRAAKKRGLKFERASVHDAKGAPAYLLVPIRKDPARTRRRRATP